MSKELSQLYMFSDFCLDAAERVLLRNGRPVALTPKAFETLLFLVRRSGHIVEKDELLKEIWPETFVEEATLAQNVFTLRKALGQHGLEGQQYIETVPRRGYRFVATVRELSAEDDVLVVEKHSLTQTLTEELETFPAADEAATGNGSNDFSRNGQTANQGAGALAVAAAAPSPAEHHLTRSPSSAGEHSKREHQTKVIVLALATLIITGVAIVIAVKQFTGERPPSNNSASPFQSMRITSLTTSGKVRDSVISPDGKYLAYVLADAGDQSLWVRQTETTGNIQIVAPEKSTYAGLTFSPDGNHIFYTLYKNNSNIASLYQVSAIGGAPRQLINDLDSPVTFSPDGKHIAFLRGYIGESGKEVALIVANVDGSGERRIGARRGEVRYSYGGPAWSPDGKTVACVGEIAGDVRSMYLFGVNVEDGQERKLSAQKWETVEQMAWLTDGSGLVITASSADTDDYLQIWHVSYPGGETRRITNDLNNYKSVSLSADASTLVSVQSYQMVGLWISRSGEVGRAEPLTGSAGGKLGEISGLSWTPDNKIVYGLTTNGNTDIWLMENDGGNQRQLTFEARSDFAPAVSPDGKLIAYLSTRTGSSQVWTMNLDGSNQRRLTDGGNKGRPRWSPDGKWIVFALYGASSDAATTIWRIPSGGGEPERLINKSSLHPAVSPDGRLIACYYWDERARKSTIAIFPFEGGEPLRLLDTPTLSFHWSLQWTPDGRALEFIRNIGDASNIWRVPFDGGAPEQVDNFQPGLVRDFTRSRDGKQIIYTHAIVSKDAVLLRAFR